MTSRPGLAPPSIPQQGTAADIYSAETLHRHNDDADSARPKHGALAHRECILLVPAEPAGDPDAAETQVSGEGH